MDVYTIQLGKGSLALDENIPVVDTSVESGRPEFAPTWRMILDLRAGSMNQQEFIQAYYSLMETSQQQNPMAWHDLLKNESIAIGGQVMAGGFCQRHLFVNVLEQYAIAHGTTFSRMGEIE